MVFSSIEFLLLFLPVFLLLYGIAPQRLKNVILLSGSLVFYALGEPKYLLLLLGSVLINYWLGLHIARRSSRRENGAEQKLAKSEKRRKRLLFLAVTGNIGLLAVFKYGTGEDGLPLGISFYTFQALSYLIDVYRGEQRREESFVRFASYITMFPQLVSGPIVLYGEVRQRLRRRRFCLEQLSDGLKCFTAGLVLKVLLADRIGLLWQEIQVTGFASVSTALAWLGAAAYSLEIYFDFYGYSLMAAGLGRVLGFELPENFREPYMAVSVREFYRRWHMTLGRWFCRYVYIPLGGSRQGEFRTVCNLLIVWFLTAVWHGNTPNFLIWGMSLCLLIIMERRLEAMGARKLFSRGVLKIVPHLYLWFVIPVTWICFAVTDLSQLQICLGRMFGLTEGIRVSAGDWQKALASYGYLFAAGFFACTPLAKRLYERWKDRLPGMAVLAVLFWICVWRLKVEGHNPFMYRYF